MNNQLTELKPSLEFRIIAGNAAKLELDPQNESTKKELYEKMADKLLDEGFPKPRIALLIIEEVESRMNTILKRESGLEISQDETHINRRWVYRVLSPLGFSDPLYGENTTEQKETTGLGHSKNSSINTQNVTRILTKVRNMCDDYVNLFKNGVEIDPAMTPKEWKMFLHQWESFVDTAIDAKNEKTKVPSNMVSILLELICSETTANNAGKIFMKRRYQMMDDAGKFIDPKQTGKFKRGLISDQPVIYKPDSRDIAIFGRYVGLQCPHCESWMVKEKTDSKTLVSKLECIECEKTFMKKTVSKCRYCQIPLYKERLVHIIKTGRCENCNTDNELPDEILDYADPEKIIRKATK